MTIERLARAIEARLVVSNGRGYLEITRVCGGATMSDLISNAGPGTLLVTSLANVQLIRIAELMDVPGICFAEGKEPGQDLVSQARAAGTALYVSGESLQITLDRAARSLALSEEGRR